MTTATATIAFEPGRTYFGRFINDYDSTFRFTVERRTAKFVWLKGSDGKVKRRGVRIWDGVETCLPFGSYSMAPSIKADRKSP